MVIQWLVTVVVAVRVHMESNGTVKKITYYIRC